MTESLTERAQRLYPLSLQPADERDIEAIVSLLNRAYRSSERAASWTSETGMIDGDRISAATLREEIASKPDATLLVWKPEDKVAGCVWLEPVTADLWYLGSLAVDPQRQNGGNGRKILEAAEQWCHLYGAKRIQMTVLEKRKELVAWYERRGYQQTGETEPFPLDDTRFGIPLVADLRFVFMEKSL